MLITKVNQKISAIKKTYSAYLTNTTTKYKTDSF